MENDLNHELLTFWENLIFTFNAPHEPQGWALRGHHKEAKPKAWFQMTILSNGCETKDEAISKAIEFTKLEVGKSILGKFEE